MLGYITIIQWTYTLPSLIFYYYFTILLTYEICIKKNHEYNNGFYPLILLKSYADIITITNSFLTLRLPRHSIFSNFYLNNQYLASVQYFETGLTNTIMYIISFLISFNRFIAIKYPLRYSFWFSSKIVKIYILLSILFGFVIGYLIITFKPYYKWNDYIGVYYISFKDKYIGIFTVFYTLFFFLPIAITATIMNLISAYELSKYRKSISIETKKELYLFFYTVINFIAFLIFFLYFSFRSCHIIFNIPILQKIALISAPWIIDIETFGLFYSLLIIWYVLYIFINFLLVRHYGI
uniref:G_PROTEIN_RECEP_F1_2 domain-containing protein n=1 Tax=Parastrongyloides trichosuri TaxID=131310 RepID=A0A0N4ZP46_PARTI